MKHFYCALLNLLQGEFDKSPQMLCEHVLRIIGGIMGQHLS